MAEELKARDIEDSESFLLPCGVSRRSLLRTAGVGGAAVAVGLTAVACSSSSGPVTGTPATAAPTGPAALGSVASVTVGGGAFFSDPPVVVTEPVAGEYKGFSGVCTHQGGILNKVADNVITCPLHGSQFSAKDGSVVRGPATEPLPSVAITVADGIAKTA
jgi:Rieske Fe-S protein